MKRLVGILAAPVLAASIWCLAACCLPEPGPQPLKISGLRATIAGNGIMSLEWTETGSAGHVEIVWTPDGTTAYIVTAGTAAYDATGLGDATDYTFTATSFDGNGNSTATLTASATTAPSGAAFISDAAGLGAINSALGGYYVLTSDIDLSSQSFTPIGTLSSQFTGTFDGNGHVIANLTLTGNGNYQGLFGVAYGTVKNLGVTNVNVSGGACVGGLVGLNYGSIDNCYATGTINASGNYIGGLVGNAMGTFTCCPSGFVTQSVI